MVCARALPLAGGVETHVHEVSTRLAAAGVDVTVLTTDAAGNLPVQEDRNGYRIARWPAYPRSRDYYFAPGLGSHLRRSAHRYDVVHVQGVHSLVAPTALASARAARLPAIVTFHTGGHSSRAREWVRPLQWRVLAPLLGTAGALVAVCDYERRLFARVLRIPEHRVRLIPNGSTPLPVEPGAAEIRGRPLLVSVGRLERYKGHHRVLAAMPTILRTAPGAMLVLAGSGPYEGALREMAAGLGVEDHVLIRSFTAQHRAHLGRLVADADLVCLLSEYEAHPISVLEALGCGTRVLAADTSGLTELGRHPLVTIVPIDAPPERIAPVALDLAALPRADPAALPTWDDCADQLLRLYRDTAG